MDEEARIQAELARVRARRTERKYTSPSPTSRSPAPSSLSPRSDWPSPTSTSRMPLDDGPCSPRSSWEPMVAGRIMGLHERGDGGPLLVAIVGPPGCGKTTSAAIVAQMVPGCVVLPMDGYHIPLATLKSMPDAQAVVYRRGAPDTFDPTALRAALRQVKQGDQPTVEFPGFDHATGDPVAAQHVFDRAEHKVVIVEGLYLLRREDAWAGTGDLFDLTIFIESDINECISRLKVRNQCIPGYTAEEINTRCEDVDRANAMLVKEDQQVADMVVPGLASHKMAAFQNSWSYSWQARSVLSSLDGPQSLKELSEELPPQHFPTRPVCRQSAEKLILPETEPLKQRPR